jgi:HEAT repeat protein
MRFIAAVLAVAIPSSTLAQEMEQKEITEVAGRTIEQWIKEIGHKDPSKRELAIRSVMVFGPEKAYQAAPALLAELRRHTPGVPIDTSVRVNIAIALGPIFAAAKNPDLKMQQEAVTLLTRLLRDSQAIVKYRAAQSLGMIGQEAKSATTDLLLLLRDGAAWEVRQAAATALGQVSFDPRTGPAPQVLNALYERVKEDAALQVRLACIQALVMAGPSTDSAHRAGMFRVIEPLTRKDAEPALQIWAHLAVMNLSGKLNDDNIEQIARFLRKGDVLTRAQAAQAIGAVGAKAKETIPALMDGLADPDPTVLGWMIWAISRMETHATKAIPALEKLAADAKQSDQIKKAAKMSIEQIKKAKTSTEK